MSKRQNVAYVKPEEPSFLRKLKEQAGYKEGPTVDTKREDLTDFDEDNNRPDIDEEQPTVVVLKPGDLTAEEAAQEQLRLEKEAAEAPADLSKRLILFKRPEKSKNSIGESSNKRSSDNIGTAASKKLKKLTNKSLLSFDEDEFCD